MVGRAWCLGIASATCGESDSHDDEFEFGLGLRESDSHGDKFRECPFEVVAVHRP